MPFRFATLLLPLLLLPAPAFAAMGEWVEGEHVRLRLVAAGIGPDGRLDAAIEIALDDGWDTYWRDPGEAGIAPVLDFSASANAADARVAFRAPERRDDGFAVTNVYTAAVTLPVSLAVPDPAQPVDLRLSADLGVCEQVCIPVHLDAVVTVPPGERDQAVAASIIAEAKAWLPEKPRPGALAAEGIRRTGGDDTGPQYEIEVSTPEPAASVLFVETPADWYPTAAQRVAEGAGKATFRLVIDRKTARTPLAGADLRYTLAVDDEAVEGTLRLP
jgi:suppressor for copper-sensitivity B